MSGITLDETGLHAEACECPKCDLGLGPTPIERAAARRALAQRKLAEAAKLEAQARALKTALPVREPPRVHMGPSRPYTQEQNAELVRMRADFRAGKKVTDADH